MRLKIGYVRNIKIAYIHSFEISRPSTTECTNRTDPSTYQLSQIAPSELIHENIDLLFYSAEAEKNIPELSVLLNDNEKFYPVVATKVLGLDNSDDNDSSDGLFQNISNDKIYTCFREYQSNWVLRHNLQLIENIFQCSESLNSIIENERTTFFEELWSLLRVNLGSSFLKIIYHDLELDETGVDLDGEIVASTTTPSSLSSESSEDLLPSTSESKRLKKKKGKLVNMSVSGSLFPSTERGGELEQTLMSIYGPKCTVPLQISEFSSAKGECLFLAQVKGNPVVIMANLWELNKLIPPTLKALFSGLNSSLSRNASTLFSNGAPCPLPSDEKTDGKIFPAYTLN